MTAVALDLVGLHVTGHSFGMLAAVLATAVPALGVVLAGALLDQPLLAWTGAATGLLTGTACHVLLGVAATRRLRDRGPELLHLMRAGIEHAQRSAAGGSVFTAMSGPRRTILWTSLLVGAIALFPQALVPIGLKLTSGVERVWFLALYMPEPLQWPTIALMIMTGLAGIGVAAWIYLSEMNTTQHTRTGVHPS